MIWKNSTIITWHVTPMNHYLLFKLRETPISPVRTHKIGFYTTWFHYTSLIGRCDKVRRMMGSIILYNTSPPVNNISWPLSFQYKNKVYWRSFSSGTSNNRKRNQRYWVRIFWKNVDDSETFNFDFSISRSEIRQKNCLFEWAFH